MIRRQRALHEHHKTHGVYHAPRHTCAHYTKHNPCQDLPTHPKHSHKLSEGVDWHENLILPKVRAYIDTEIANADRKVARRSPFALNGAIGNGASSQAMAFNLIGPLITRGDLEPLREVIEAAGIPWPQEARAAFEVEERSVFNEQRGQPTSIDLVVNGGPADSGPIMIEVKLPASFRTTSSTMLLPCLRLLSRSRIR